MRTSIFIAVLSTLTFFNCQKHDNPIQVSENTPLVFSYSHQDSVEGTNIALWFDGNLLAADSTKSRLMYSLKYLRQTYADSQTVHPSLDSVFLNRFFPPWVIGELSIGFDSTTAIQVRNHQYTGWNSLDIAIRPDTILQAPDLMGDALLGFSEPYNPARLAESYKTLPGVRWAEPNYAGYILGGYPVYPGKFSGEMGYVFLKNYDMEIHGPFYYFQYKNGKPIFVGEWSGSTVSLPWGSAVQESVDSFSVWKGY